MKKQRLLPVDDDVSVIDIEDFEDVSDLEKNVEDQIDAAVAEFGEDKDITVKFKIYQILEKTGEKDWLFDCLVSDFPIMEMLRDKYGTGAFLVRMYVASKLKRAFTIRIRAPITGQYEKPRSAEKEIAQLMSEGFLKLGEVIANNQNMQNNQPVVPAFDPIAMQSSFIAQMLQMKELFGVTQPQPSDGPVKMLKTFLELQKSFSGSSGEGAGMNDVLVSLINTFGGPIATMTQKTQQLEHQKKQALLAQQRGQTPTQPQQPEKGKENMNLKFKAQLAYLCNIAAKNGDPEVYANVILDQTDNPDELVAFCGQPDAIEKMIAIHKGVEAYKEWFEELGAILIDLTEQPESSIETIDADQNENPQPINVNPGREGGNVANAQINAVDSEPSKKDHVDKGSSLATGEKEHTKGLSSGSKKPAPLC